MSGLCMYLDVRSVIKCHALYLNYNLSEIVMDMDCFMHEHTPLYPTSTEQWEI